MINNPHNTPKPSQQRSLPKEKAQSVLNPIQSHLKQHSHFNNNPHRVSHLRFRSKQTNIKSLFKNAKQANGQTFLSNPKRKSLMSHRNNSQQKQLEQQLKRSAKMKKLQIAPSFQICINNEQDLSLIINEFKQPLVHLIKGSLQQIRQGRGKESESFDSVRNTV